MSKNRTLREGIDKLVVNEPFLPPLEEYIDILSSIWRRKILTNNGPLVSELEVRLANYLDVRYVSVFANGFLALMSALRVLGLKGEIITTPFSFIATSNAIQCSGNQSIFCDVRHEDLTINHELIENMINKRTVAILPVHIYGNPAHVCEIQKIAERHKLKVIYDAAHAFGVKQDDQTILNFGDISVLSFHATKVFNTFEGGAVVCHDEDTKKKLDQIKNHGLVDNNSAISFGLNCKMNELQAAMGLIQLKYIDKRIKRLEEISKLYHKHLDMIPGLHFLGHEDTVKYNYSYFPIFIDERVTFISRNLLLEKLRDYEIYARDYFHPLISDLPPYKNNAPLHNSMELSIARDYSSRVICLPIHSELTNKNIKYICATILEIILNFQNPRL